MRETVGLEFAASPICTRLILSSSSVVCGHILVFICKEYLEDQKYMYLKIYKKDITRKMNMSRRSLNYGFVL